MASKAYRQAATFGWPFALKHAARGVPRPMRGLLAVAALVVFAGAGPGATARVPAGKPSVVVFGELSPLASAAQIARRTQTPMTADRMSRFLEAQGKALAEHMIDIASEEFDLYVPARQPPNGYGVLVWIPPFDQGQPVPRAWRGELERSGIIYAAPRRAGNSQVLVERRIPLAVHAAHNVMVEYRVDPSRVYVGGFSGGARAALRTAVAYPDVFRGGVLNAGSDEIGGANVPVPPVELIELLQTQSRLVYLTGARDLPNRRRDERSQASAARLCIANVHRISMGRAEHAPPGGRDFARALSAVQSPASDSATAADCRARLRQRVQALLVAVEALVDAGRLQEAGDQLHVLDQHWGGLAAPPTVALARCISAAQARGSACTDPQPDAESGTP